MIEESRQELEIAPDSSLVGPAAVGLERPPVPVHDRDADTGQHCRARDPLLLKGPAAQIPVAGNAQAREPARDRLKSCTVSPQRSASSIRSSPSPLCWPNNGGSGQR